jgi:hypothetical protein
MTNKLMTRGCPTELIKCGISKAKFLDINTLRKPKEKNNTTDNPNNTNNPNNISFCSQVITKNKHFLQQDPTLKDIVQNTKIINAKRQPADLKRILTKAKFGDDGTFNVKRCGKSRCQLCPDIIEGDPLDFFFLDNSGK